MTFHFKLPTTCQPTTSPGQALGEEKRKLPFLDKLSRDLKREASPLFIPLYITVYIFGRQRDGLGNYESWDR
jgi:hypothetical protein